MTPRTPRPGVSGGGAVKVRIDPDPAVTHRFHRISVIEN